MRLVKRSHRSKTIDILFALLLFAIFAVSVLFVLLFGGRIYKGAVDEMTEQYRGRTGISYIVTKLRSCDSKDAVAIERFGDSDALILTEGDGEIRYVTTIYLHDGVVREQYTEDGKRFSPETGTEIVDAKSINFSFADDGKMILIEYETVNGIFETHVYLRSKGTGS